MVFLSDGIRVVLSKHVPIILSYYLPVFLYSDKLVAYPNDKILFYQIVGFLLVVNPSWKGIESNLFSIVGNVGKD